MLVSAGLFAQGPPILANGSQVPNWTVPTYTRSSAEGGLRTMTDISPGIAFVAMVPCRVFDTRNANGAYGGPRLIGNVTRNFDIDSGPCSPIPSGVEAYSMNFGAIFPDGANSFITIWPTGATQPTVSSMNPIQGAVVANAAIVPAGTGGSISIFPNTGVHLYGDINGYFTDDFDNGTGNYFQVYVNSGSYAIQAGNLSTSCGGTCGGFFWAYSGHGAEGDAYGTGEVYGVYGYSAGDSDYAAGIRGDAPAANANGGYFSNAGAAQTGGGATFLATQVGGVNYSVYSGQRILGGSLVISGAPKSFAAPHPDDPGLEIRYASVEAPTVDVYFRGTGELQNGIARIDIPDHFRYTALEGTYMTTLTPVGRAVAVTVESEGPDGIVVRGTGNTRFHYVVYAERAETRGFEPVMKNETFTPEALAKGRLESLPDATRALLVHNGTLNPDGRTFNLGTAQAQGWRVPAPRTDPEANRPTRSPSP
jgi:hypothetical protein